MRLLLALALVFGTMQAWAQEIPQKPQNPNKPKEMPAKKNTVVSSDCDWGDCVNGYGKKTYDNGDYIGFWRNGKKEGYGSYYWFETKGQYIGEWTDDNMHGYGVYIGENKDNLKGQYRNGSMNGIGVTVRNNEWEQGIFTNGSLTERYPYYSNNKNKGCSIGDCNNGYGRWDYDNGDNYIGFFENGNLKQGSYNFSSGAKYSGEFNSNNQMHGMGRYWASDGSYYGGYWANGKFNGRGYYDNKATGKKEVGVWNNGVLSKSMY
ncbi:hypothetical protein [Gilvibacter sediminis]|uniref:hypothetical protein n=1 Tax=Gilvibacter sediminis TaxID=379071 RepID=UPI002350E209|nr:hypothetical protein [Gilvibacter sediminis]MDC7997491.1 hypothetical protein [Gilvibacter sediminis]